MLIQLPDGTALDAEGSVVPAKQNTERAAHTATALDRLIERWRAERNPNLAALISSITDEVQEIEDAIHAMFLAFDPTRAVGAQLDTLGRLVGQRRNGLTDEEYRPYISARIRINQSFGRGLDVIGVIKIVETAAVFHLTEFGTASFRIDFETPPATAGVGRAIPTMVSEARAAGVSGLVSFPVDRVGNRGAFFGSTYDPALNAARGFSSSYDSTVGGLFGHTARS